MYPLIRGRELRELRELNSTQNATIEKLEEVVSTLKLENARVVEALTFEILESSTFKRNVDTLIHDRESQYTRRLCKTLQDDPSFRQDLHARCQAAMTNEVSENLAGLTKSHFSTVNFEKVTEVVGVRVISQTARRMVEEHLASQPCQDFIRDACKDAVSEVAADMTEGDLP